MSDIEPGAKRREFVKEIKPKIKEFWVGWFGDITFLKKLFRPIPPATKEIGELILGSSIFLTIPHSFITNYSSDGWSFFLNGFLWVISAGAMFIMLPCMAGYIAIKVLTFFYRIILYHDVKVSETEDIIYGKLENLLYYGIIFWPLVIFGSIVIHLIPYTHF